MNIKITVITASYNSERFLRETVESVAKQTVKPFEHLIIDDKSSDNSLQLARSLAAEFPSIRVIEHDANKGFPSALNTGIAASKTDYIAILDSDDIALPYWLEKSSNFLNDHPKAGVVGGGCIIMTEKGEITDDIKFIDKKGDVTDDILDGKYMVLHPGSIINKNILNTFDGYAEDLKSLEDNDMFINVASVSQVYNLGQPLIYYRRLKSSESRKSSEFSLLASEYILLKVKLIKANDENFKIRESLNSVTNKLKETKRLQGPIRGQYEYEMAISFFKGKHYLKSIRYLAISIFSSFVLTKILKKIKLSK